MKLFALVALTLSLSAGAATDCDRVLDHLLDLGVSKGTTITMIAEHETNLKSYAVYQENFNKYPSIQTLGAYDRASLKEEVRNTKAAIKRLELNLYGIIQLEPRVKASAKEQCR